MIVETREPIPAKPGRKVRHDYEYARNGVANLFMMFAPLEGWRHVKVTDRHAAIDYAHGKRGKTGGAGMILRFTGGHESDSLWGWPRPQTSMV